MRLPAWLAVMALGVLPAQGHNLGQGLSTAELHALTAIDTVPSRASLDDVLQAADLPQRIARLQDIALTTNIDFGVRLRAIRALPHYCTTTCRSDGVSTGDPAHLSIRKIFDSLNTSDHTGQALLRLRATIEALGVTRSGLAQDVAIIVPFLINPSRDIRVAAARALSDLCNRDAISTLLDLLPDERVTQVQLAISEALTKLDQCGQ